ncbi:MAG TPA: glucose-1-phosphate cytidylyltransferase [Vicinamibacterales bacterium]|nr:glucose-1-phosphate cytidylyltransferase [Vicinamibacterales bacterium]
MRVVILAGGRGSRLAELTEVVPKPMVHIGDRPILWHIMKHFSTFDHKEFVLALGYKGDVIKEFFLNYRLLSATITVDLASGTSQLHDSGSNDDWTIHLVETGLTTGTGGRLHRLRQWLRDEAFLLTYGDGVCDVDLSALMATHRRSGKLATVTAVRPPSRFGGLTFESGIVTDFQEKPQIGEGWINGGFMIFEPGVFKYMNEGTDSLEKEVLEQLAVDRQLAVHTHDGFWQCMDTLRDRYLLEDLWERGQAPWKRWA